MTTKIKQQILETLIRDLCRDATQRNVADEWLLDHLASLCIEWRQLQQPASDIIPCREVAA